MVKKSLAGIILAAGKGSRLNSQQPKCTIDLGGISPLVWTIERFKELHIAPIVVITGYMSSYIMKKLEESNLKENIHIIFNEHYDQTDSAHSFYLSIKEIKSPVILTYGDTMVNSKTLQKLVNSNFSNTILIQKDNEKAKMDMKVKVVDRKVIKIGKTISLESVYGESACIFKFNESSIKLLAKEYESLVPIMGKNKLWFEDLLSNCLSKMNLFVINCLKEDWVEIDTSIDLSKARKFVENNNM